MVKSKKEELNDKFELTEEEKKLLRENHNDISLMKGVLENLQRKNDQYEINLARFYYRIDKALIEYDYNDDLIREVLSLTDETIKVIRSSILTNLEE